MRGTLLALLVVALSPISAEAQELEKIYAEGLVAAREARWDDLIEAMERAIAIDPDPRVTIVLRRERHPYIPYYWLGKAWMERGDYARAMEYFRRSGTGIIARTTYFTDYRAMRSVAEARLATGSSGELESVRARAADARKAALSAQSAAIRAGASRTEEFVNASRSLQSAVQEEGAGTIEGYRGAAEAAQRAEELFLAAIDRASGSRRARILRPTEPVADEPVIAENEPVIAETEPEAESASTELPDPLPEPPPTDRSEELRAEAVVPPPSEPREEPAPQSTTPAPAIEPPRASRERAKADPFDDVSAVLQSAFNMIARGDYQASSNTLSTLIERRPREPEALLLRGYARFVSSVLESDEELLEAAREDFMTALAIDETLYLDERWFSPKASAFLESLRQR